MDQQRLVKFWRVGIRVIDRLVFGTVIREWA